MVFFSASTLQKFLEKVVDIILPAISSARSSPRKSHYQGLKIILNVGYFLVLGNTGERRAENIGGGWDNSNTHL